MKNDKLKNFLDLYKHLHGIHITLDEFWNELMNFAKKNHISTKNFKKKMTVEEASALVQRY